MEQLKPTQMAISKVYASWTSRIDDCNQVNEYDSFGSLIIDLIEIGMTKLNAFYFIMQGFSVTDYELETQYLKETRLRAVWHAEDMGSSAGPDGSWFGDEYE